MKLLVVEDEPLLRHFIGVRLKESGYLVDTARDAKEALYYLASYVYDAAVVDLGLPDVSGMELIDGLRGQGLKMPVLILTSRGGWRDKVAGLSIGGDDYMVKPFQFEELEARLKSLVRRSLGFMHFRVSSGPMVLDFDKKEVIVEGEVVNLTAYEYRILEFLVRNKQRVVTKEELLEAVRGDRDDGDPNVIEVLIGRLRKKISANGSFKPIETVRAQGYIYSFECD